MKTLTYEDVCSLTVGTRIRVQWDNESEQIATLERDWTGDTWAVRNGRAIGKLSPHDMPRVQLTSQAPA